MPEEPKAPTDNQKEMKALLDASEDTPVESTPILIIEEQKTSSNEPTAMTPDHMARPWLNEQPQKKKKGLILGFIIAVAVLVVGVGGWAAYALWYQNPDKVLMDAMVNAMTSNTATFSGSLNSKIGESTVDMTFKGQTGHKEGSSGSLNLSYKPDKKYEFKLDAEGARTASGDNFVKINNLKGIYGQLIDLFAETPARADSADSVELKKLYESILGPIVQRVDGKWVKFGIEDVKKLNAKFGEEYGCTEKIISKLPKEGDLLREVGELYVKNKFIVIKKSLGTSGANVGFLIDLDDNAMQRFAGSIKDTKLYKEFQKCSTRGNNPLDFKVSENPSSGENTFEVWIDQWSHQLSKLKSSGSSTEDGQKITNTLELVTTFNSAVKVDIPTKDIIPFNDAFSEIAEYFGRVLEGQTALNQGASDI